MKPASAVLENQDGQVIRYINIPGGALHALFRRDLNRIEFVSQLQSLEDQKIHFEYLSEVTMTLLKKAPIAITPTVSLRLVQEDENETLPVRTDEVLKAEDQKRFPLYVKYSASAHVVLLAVVFSLSWVLSKFIAAPPEPVIVQVFEQQREKMQTSPAPTVSVSQNKVQLRKQLSPAIAQKSAKNSSRRSNNQQANRPGLQVANRGALGAFGGMGRQYNGTGGLNLKATRDNPGIGYGGRAQRGGFERGMIGHGLVAAGVGGGGSLQGYGGNADTGLGGGRPGYGANGRSMAGASGAYFVPLSDDTIIEGGLDQDQIQSVVQSHIGQVVNCYEKGLQTQPKLAGRVAVHFIINGSGQVTSARVSNSTVGSRLVESCIVSRLEDWKFPRPVNQVNVRVVYPFVLKRLSAS